MPRVMIVEDDLTILSNLSQLLQLSGLDVTEAHDGRMALGLLQQGVKNEVPLPMMIVSDLMMPHMDGFELLLAVRSSPALEALPFVLLSARSDASDLQRAFVLGASDYLIKPFELEQLINVIRYQLSKVIEPPTSFPGDDASAGNRFFLE